MMIQLSQSPATPTLAHRILERLTAAKTHAWMLRKRLHRGQIEPSDAEAHLQHIETQIDEAAALATNLQDSSLPSP